MSSPTRTRKPATKTQPSRVKITAAPNSVVPSWAQSAAELMDRWVHASERSLRNQEIFRGGLNLGDRLERLLAVAFARRVSHLSTDHRIHTALDISERFADWNASPAELVEARSDVWIASAEAKANQCYQANSAAFSAAYAIDARVGSTAAHAANAIESSSEWSAQGELLISVVGPGWEFDSAWRTSTAIGLAVHAYEGREWSVMSILADALQDAGCEDATILDRLRDPAALWCRGCRIVDELLLKRSQS